MGVFANTHTGAYSDVIDKNTGYQDVQGAGVTILTPSSFPTISKLKMSSPYYWDGSSGYDSSYWVWRVPSLNHRNATNSSIDWSYWDSYKYRYSWDSH